jgi:hypothetical protein
MYRFKLVVVLSVLFAFVGTSAAIAEDVPGEIWVKLVGSDYAKPYTDNREFEDHEFEDNGFKLIIKLADYTNGAYYFTLKPSNSELASVEIASNPKKFRRKKVGRRDYRMVMRIKVKFKRAEKAAPAVKPVLPEKAAPAVIPALPEKAAPAVIPALPEKAAPAVIPAPPEKAAPAVIPAPAKKRSPAPEKRQ